MSAGTAVKIEHFDLAQFGDADGIDSRRDHVSNAMKLAERAGQAIVSPGRKTQFKGPLGRFVAGMTSLRSRSDNYVNWHFVPGEWTDNGTLGAAHDRSQLYTLTVWSYNGLWNGSRPRPWWGRVTVEISVDDYGDTFVMPVEPATFAVGSATSSEVTAFTGWLPAWALTDGFQEKLKRMALQSLLGRAEHFGFSETSIEMDAFFANAREE